MQIAGVACRVCHQPVGTMRSGSGCEKCQIVVHQACVPAGACPNCGQVFLPAEIVHARLSESQQTNLDRPRSVAFLGRLALVGAFIWALRALAGLGMMTADIADGTWRMIEAGVMTALSTALGLGLLAGHDWARRFYLWGVPLILIAKLALDSRIATPGLWRWVFISQTALYGLWAFVLTRPTATQFFRRRSAERSADRAA